MSGLDKNIARYRPPDASDRSLWQPTSEERILILAPHPDDEVLAAGGVIASTSANRSASPIQVVVVTNGDASYLSALSYGRHTLGQQNFRRLAVMRQQESLSALVFLGLSARQIRFWGFPDRGLTPIWQSYWDTRHPYHSPTTGFDKSEQTMNSPVLLYTGTSLLALLQVELSEFRPTTVIMPHPQDAHLDHRALARFTLLSIAFYQAQYHLPAPNLLAYVMWQRNIFWLNGSRIDGHGVFSMDKQSAANNEQQYLPLSPEIRKQKTLALQCYRSQRFSALQPLHNSTESAYEAFVSLRPYLVDEMRQTNL